MLQGLLAWLPMGRNSLRRERLRDRREITVNLGDSDEALTAARADGWQLLKVTPLPDGAVKLIMNRK